MRPSGPHRRSRTDARSRAHSPARSLLSAQAPSRVAIEKHPVDAIPLEIREQATQSRTRALEVHVMAKSGFRAQTLEARLVGVELPRVEVEHRRLPVDRVDAAQRPPRNAIGQQA